MIQAGGSVTAAEFPNTRHIPACLAVAYRRRSLSYAELNSQGAAAIGMQSALPAWLPASRLRTVLVDDEGSDALLAHKNVAYPDSLERGLNSRHLAGSCDRARIRCWVAAAFGVPGCSSWHTTADPRRSARAIRKGSPRLHAAKRFRDLE